VGPCTEESNDLKSTSPASLNWMVIVVAHFSQSQKCSTGFVLLKTETTAFSPAIALRLPASVKLTRNSLPRPKYLNAAEHCELRHFDTMKSPASFDSRCSSGSGLGSARIEFPNSNAYRHSDAVCFDTFRSEIAHTRVAPYISNA
jgi:hypothetical protein